MEAFAARMWHEVSRHRAPFYPGVGPRIAHSAPYDRAGRKRLAATLIEAVIARNAQP